MRVVFESQGAKGVVINCTDCGMNHYFGWELLKESLEHMLQTGEPRMHEPAFAPNEEDYIAWDYAKGYLDALGRRGPGARVAVRRAGLPVVQYQARARLLVLPPVRPHAGGRPPVRRARRARPGRARRAGDADPRRVRATGVAFFAAGFRAGAASLSRSTSPAVFFAVAVDFAGVFFAAIGSSSSRDFFAAGRGGFGASSSSSSSAVVPTACGSMTVSSGSLSSRRPLNDGARIFPTRVICRYSTSHDQLGPHPVGALHPAELGVVDRRRVGHQLGAAAS